MGSKSSKNVGSVTIPKEFIEPNSTVVCNLGFEHCIHSTPPVVDKPTVSFPESEPGLARVQPPLGLVRVESGDSVLVVESTGESSIVVDDDLHPATETALVLDEHIADDSSLVVDEPIQDLSLVVEEPVTINATLPVARAITKEDYRQRRNEELKRKILSKNGEPYSEYKKQIRPFDLVLFKGGDFVSDTIRIIEKRLQGYGDFSHCGMIITTAVLDHPRMKPGKLYIIESTVTGFLGCGVKNIDGKSKFCVQITDFDELVEAYDKNSHTALAISHVLTNPYDIDPVHAKANFTEFYRRMSGMSYQFNIYTLLCAVFPRLRFAKKTVNSLMSSERWVFCSQLVFMAYQALGVYDKEIDSSNVVPVDFLGYDVDVGKNRVELKVDRVPTYIISHRWA